MKQFVCTFIVLFFSLQPCSAGALGSFSKDDMLWKDLRTGQAHMSIGGAFRIRCEFYDGYDLKKYGIEENESFLLSRLRLDFDLRLAQKLKTFFQLQDARIFGSSFDDADFTVSNPYHDDMDIRRGGALLLIFDCVYHLVYCMVYPEGRRDFIQMLPYLKDFCNLDHNLLWFVGLRDSRPAFGRFTYFEKFDYWAVFWGCVILVGTGLVMWFPHVAGILLSGITPDGI